MKIGICGGICSGKTTISNQLCEKFNLTKYSFADNVKKYIKEIFDIDWKKRDLIQDFAEKIKEIDNDVWINMLDREISDKDNIIIDDVRFDNELEYLKYKGFIIIRLNIENITQIKRIKNKYPDEWKQHVDRLLHVSEIGRTYFNVDLDVDSNNEQCIDMITSFLLKSYHL